jgi:hypothetical protein
MLRKVLGQLGRRDAAVRIASLPGPALATWLWRWWRACAEPTYLANRSAMLTLATASLARTRELATDLSIEHERAQGLLVLLRSEQELAWHARSLLPTWRPIPRRSSRLPSHRAGLDESTQIRAGTTARADAASASSHSA